MTAIVQAILKFLIALLAPVIPWLNSLVNSPFGFIAKIVLNAVTSWITGLINKLGAYAAIDSQVAKDVTAAKNAQITLAAVQNNPAATEADHAKALADFTDRVRTLGKFRL